MVSRKGGRPLPKTVAEPPCPRLKLQILHTSTFIKLNITSTPFKFFETFEV